MQKAFSPLLKIGISAFSYLWATSNIVSAQVTPDGTTNTVVNSDGSNFNIGQGDRAGNNLFHSFDNFSVPTNGSAVFNNAADITNIFNRVTGGNISNIDGLIQASGSANLFLVNPAGIIFGNNARLDIGGSFYGSTADSILFEDGVFSATDLDNPPLLTINAPIGLNLRDNPEPIVNSSFVQNEAEEFVGLEVEPGNNFSLIGGDINFDSGEVTARGGRVELGGLSSAGTVTIKPNGSLTFPDGVNRANVTFSNAADVDVLSEGGGSIFVNANNISLLGGEFGGSSLRAGILSSQTSADAQAGNISFDATGTVTISDGSFISNSTFGMGNAGQVQIESIGAVEISGDSSIFNTVETDAVGSLGGIIINARSLSIAEGSQIQTLVRGSTSSIEGEQTQSPSSNRDSDLQTEENPINSSTSGQGSAGNININVVNAINISGFSEDDNGNPFFSQVSSILGTDALGSAGNINIQADSFSITDGAFIAASTFGLGDAGNITIDTVGAVNLNNNAQIFGIVGANAVADESTVNTIEINAGSLAITDSLSLIQTSTSGLGNAGNIFLNIDGTVEIIGGSFSSEVFTDVLGNAGDIEINSASVSFSEEAFLSSSTNGQGNAGNVSINITDSVLLSDSSSIFSQVSSNGAGNGGEIVVDTNNLSLINGSQITAAVFGQGNAGSVTIDARDITFEGIDSEAGFPAGILNSVQFGGTGNAGDIQINTERLSLIDGGIISSDNNAFELGNAGDIQINAADNVTVSGLSEFAGNEEFSAITRFSQISSLTGIDAVGNAGNIQIEAGSLNISDRAILDSSTFGQGDAGNISINSNSFVALEGAAAVSSNAGESAEGLGGEINIQTQTLSILDGSEISTQTFNDERGGNITINATNSLDISGTAELSALDSVAPNNFPSGLFANSTADTGGDAGSITVQTKDLKISDNGTINIDSLGQGNAGNIVIESESLELNNNASISSTSASESSFSSNIDILVEDNLVLRNNSSITVDAFGAADGSNISIDAGLALVIK